MVLVSCQVHQNLATTDDEYTALMYAAQDGHVEVARLLLERAADPNLATTDDGVTALILAADEGRLEIVQLLVSFGADLSAGQSAAGSTPTPAPC